MKPKMAKRFALLRLMACLLGCTFDDLRRRDRERQRRRQLAWGLVAASVLIFGTSAGVTYWERMQPATAHYRHLVWRWGLPEGLGEVDRQTLSTRTAVTCCSTFQENVVSLKSCQRGNLPARVALRERELWQSPLLKYS